MSLKWFAKLGVCYFVLWILILRAMQTHQHNMSIRKSHQPSHSSAQMSSMWFSVVQRKNLSHLLEFSFSPDILIASHSLDFEHFSIRSTWYCNFWNISQLFSILFAVNSFSNFMATSIPCSLPLHQHNNRYHSLCYK